MLASSNSRTSNTDLPIVLGGDNSSLKSIDFNGEVSNEDVLLDVTVGADEDASAPVIDLDAKAFSRDALARIARKEGITLDEARQLVLAEQVARKQVKNVLETGDVVDADTYFAEEVVGYMTVSKRIVKKVIHRQNKPRKSTKPRKPKARVECLSDDSRRAKWEAFENLDIDAYVQAAEAMGMRVAFVTFKVPKVKDWMKRFNMTPATMKGKDAMLQQTLRTIGAKFVVTGYSKAFHGVWVLENTTMGIKRPHFHLVMMLPAGGEEFVRSTWIKKAGLPTDLAPNDTVHVSYAKDNDDRDVVTQFRDATRYLSKKKYEQERVNQEWLDAGYDVGDMWDTRGFKPYPSEKVAIKRKHVEPIREVMTEVTTRPVMKVDEETGEVNLNVYPRWAPGAAYGNREIMNDTSEVVVRLVNTIEADLDGLLGSGGVADLN